MKNYYNLRLFLIKLACFEFHFLNADNFSFSRPPGGLIAPHQPLRQPHLSSYYTAETAEAPAPAL